MKFLLLLLLAHLAHSYSLCSNSSDSCLPCPEQCSACQSQSSCSTCDIQYYYSNSTTGNCDSCPENCLTCSSSTICTTCMNPYVLTNQTCSLCVIQYALSCTTTVSASSCQSGYYLNDNYCYSCLLNCIKCSSAYDCTTCTTGYYLNTSIITCNPCPQGCSACNQYTPTLCTACTAGYQLSFNTCSASVCNISNCLYCSGGSVCSQCRQLYYWDGSSCLMGASVTCELGAGGPLPSDCINSCSSFAYAFNSTNTSRFQCKPYSSVYVSSVEYHQIYYYAYNHLQQLNAISSASVSSLALEVNGEYSYSMSTLTLSSVPNFYRLQIILKYAASSAQLLKLSASTPTGSSQNESHSLSASSTAIGIIINSTVVHSNNLVLSSNSSLNLIQMRIRFWKCSSGCTICLNQQLCQLCNSPNFMLSYNCVSNCTVYIHFLPNRTCLTSCPSKFYQIVSGGLKFCQACTSPCSDCSNSTLCLSCISGYYYYSYSCLTTCPSGYFADASTNTCKTCISPCKTCTSLSACLSCTQGFWNGSVCSNSCPSGQYGDTVNYVCVGCDASCLTCITTAVTCTSCAASLILYNKQCLSSCPSRYYSSNGTCAACVPPCYTCSSSLTCQSCTYNYLFNSTCLSNCPTSYYANSAGLICSSCLSSCKTCTSGTSCTSCNSGCLYSGNCLSSCPTLQYFQQITNGSQCSCVQCVYPCNTCSNESVCLTCLEGYYYNGSCLIQCPSGFFANTLNDTCSSCATSFANCIACLSSACTQCSNGFFLLSGVCLSSCPQYYYPQNQQCLFCAPCKTCTSSDGCTTCISPYALSGTSCLIECPTSMLALSVNGSLYCQACVSPCLSCSVTATNCTYCVYGYYLLNYSCLANCSAVTPTFSYYPQLATLTCQACAFPCKLCSSETWCVTCRIGYLNAITGTCSQCKLGTYAINSSCLSCPSSCTVCYSSSFCTSCTSSFYLFNNTCISNEGVCAANGYYVSGNVCYLCLQPCKTCWVTSANCTTCLDGYIYFAPNSCLVDCPAAYYTINQTCAACSAECATCISSAVYCLTCANGYFLYSANSSCLTSCPSATYLSGTSCSACQYPCLTCTSQTACLSCVSGVLIGAQCYSSCLSGYFANSSLMCEACTSPCKECTQSSTNCSQCQGGYWLLNSTCIASCPSIYFAESESDQCLKCVGLCLSCSSYVNCTACISSYILFYSVSNQVGECISSCPAGYYLANNSCIACPTACSTCVNGSACITCTGLNLQYSGTCVSSCPSGMYGFGGICYACSFPCSNCTDAYTCTSCPTGYLLVGSSSCEPGPDCPSGYYLDVAGISCNTKCAAGYYNLLNSTCSNVSCGVEAFMGADMNCYLTCPSGYIANKSLHCVACSSCEGLRFTISTKIIRDSLYLYIIFTERPQYLLSPSLTLSPSLPFLNSDLQSQLVGGVLNYTGSQNITLLLSLNSSVAASTLNLSFQSPIQTFQNPLQRSYSTMQFAGFDFYPGNLLNLKPLGAMALTCALLGLFKNPFMTDFAQVIFLLGLLDSHYPGHLASFLESSSLAHMHGLIPFAQGGTGTGKFMYLTGTGFLSNTITNWIIIAIVLGFAGLLWLALWIARKRLSYSRVHQQSESEEHKGGASGCVGLLEKVLGDFKMEWVNRLVYFNYSIVSLFALTQISDFQLDSGANVASCALAVIVLPFLVIYPLSLKNTKPKYTFLYLRKLLISGAVVLSTQDSIYAVGIISVCNVAAALLILTHKLQKYRWQTRFLATTELLQLFTLVCLSFFIMIGQGNKTLPKITLCWIIIISALSLLSLYLAHACFRIFIAVYNWKTEKDFCEGWALNKEEEIIESHHSQSAEHSIKEDKQAKEKQITPSHENMQSLLPATHEEKREGVHSAALPRKHPRKEGDFWAYESQESQSQKIPEKPLPQMLVRCVNEFSDYNTDKQE